MALSVETVNRLLASTRGYTQYVVGIATGVGLLKAANGTAITDAMGEMLDGLSHVFHGGQALWIAILPIMSFALSQWSSWTAKTSNQAAQVAAAVKDPNTVLTQDTKASLLDGAASLPEVKKDVPIVVTDTNLASAVPANNVVSEIHPLARS
jgi:hypothetical protein